MLLLLEHYTKVCLTERYVTSTRKGEKVAGWKVHEGWTFQLFSSSSSPSIISRRPQSSVTFDLRCFDCWVLLFISFNNPKSFKPGQHLDLKQKQAQFESISCVARISDIFLLNSGSGVSGVTLLCFSTVWGPNSEWEERELFGLQRPQGSVRLTLGLFMWCGD